MNQKIENRVKELEESIKRVKLEIHGIVAVLEIHDKTMAEITKGVKEMNRILRSMKEKIDKELEEKIKYIG